MAGKKTAVFGIYSSVGEAERAVDALLLERFSNADVSVLLPDTQGSKDFAHEKNTKAPEGTATGVAAGGTIGGTLGLLARHRRAGDPGRGSVHCGRPDHGGARGSWCRRSRRRSGRSARRHGHSGIRGQDDTKDASRTAECCCPFIAIHRRRSHGRRTAEANRSTGYCVGRRRGGWRGARVRRQQEIADYQAQALLPDASGSSTCGIDGVSAASRLRPKLRR